MVTLLLHLFNGLFSRTIWVRQHQKGRTILDFSEARDDGMAVASAGPYANHLHLAPDKLKCQYLTTSFYRLDALPAAQPQCQSTEGANGHS